MYSPWLCDFRIERRRGDDLLARPRHHRSRLPAAARPGGAGPFQRAQEPVGGERIEGAPPIRRLGAGDAVPGVRTDLGEPLMDRDLDLGRADTRCLGSHVLVPSLVGANISRTALGNRGVSATAPARQDWRSRRAAGPPAAGTPGRRRWCSARSCRLPHRSSNPAPVSRSCNSIRSSNVSARSSSGQLSPDRPAAADAVGQMPYRDHIGIRSIVALDRVEIAVDQEGRTLRPGWQQDRGRPMIRQIATLRRAHPHRLPCGQPVSSPARPQGHSRTPRAASPPAPRAAPRPSPRASDRPPSRPAHPSGHRPRSRACHPRRNPPRTPDTRSA